MTDDDEGAPPYDIERALQEMRLARQRRDEVTLYTQAMADSLARGLLTHLGPEQTETAGLTLVLVAASMGALHELPLPVIINLLGFAAQRLVDDSRAADAAVRAGTQ